MDATIGMRIALDLRADVGRATLSAPFPETSGCQRR